MRILVISDTHGNAERLESVLEETGPVDMLLHCGDVEGQEELVQELAGCPCYMVRGNCDWYSSAPDEQVITADDYRILLCHGHMYGVSMGTERYLDEAREMHVQIAVFGHTHKPLIEHRGNITILNPGSLCYPRQTGRKPSYLMIETDRNHDVHYTICFLRRRKNCTKK